MRGKKKQTFLNKVLCVYVQTMLFEFNSFDCTMINLKWFYVFGPWQYRAMHLNINVIVIVLSYEFDSNANRNANRNAINWWKMEMSFWIERCMKISCKWQWHFDRHCPVPMPYSWNRNIVYLFLCLCPFLRLVVASFYFTFRFVLFRLSYRNAIGSVEDIALNCSISLEFVYKIDKLTCTPHSLWCAMSFDRRYVCIPFF